MSRKRTSFYFRTIFVHEAGYETHLALGLWLPTSNGPSLPLSAESVASCPPSSMATISQTKWRNVAFGNFSFGNFQASRDDGVSISRLLMPRARFENFRQRNLTHTSSIAVAAANNHHFPVLVIIICAFALGMSSPSATAFQNASIAPSVPYSSNMMPPPLTPHSTMASFRKVPKRVPVALQAGPHESPIAPLPPTPHRRTTHASIPARLPPQPAETTHLPTGACDPHQILMHTTSINV